MKTDAIQKDKAERLLDVYIKHRLEGATCSEEMRKSINACEKLIPSHIDWLQSKLLEWESVFAVFLLEHSRKPGRVIL